MKRKGYIRDLEFKIYRNFGKKFLSVEYNRSGEYNKYTLSNVPEWVIDEKTVREYINL